MLSKMKSTVHRGKYGLVNLDFGIDVASGEQAESAAEIVTSKRRISTASNTGLPKSAKVRLTKEGEAGELISVGVDYSSPYKGSMLEYLEMVKQGQGP